MKKYTLYISAIIITLMISACGSDQTENKTNSKSISVVVETAQLDSQAQQLSYSGKVEAAKNAVISTRMSGSIQRITVKPGKTVKKGQLLIQINDKDLKAQKSQILAAQNAAKSAFDVAKKDLERFIELFEQESASKKELEQIEMQYESRKAQYEMSLTKEEEINEALNYTSIKAPFAGVITTKFINEGELANPGMPLLGLESTTSFNINAQIPESEINQISMGDMIKVNINAAKLNNLHAKVIELNPSALHSVNQFELKLSLKLTEEQTSKLRSGMFATVMLAKNAIESISIPKSALVHKGQLTGIYTLSSQNKALLRWVRTGKQTGNNVEILSGLSAGEKYILSYQGKIWDGASVTFNK